MADRIRPRIDRPTGGRPAASEEAEKLVADAQAIWLPGTHHTEAWVRAAASALLESDVRGEVQVAVPADALRTAPFGLTFPSLTVDLHDALWGYEAAGLYALERALHRKLAERAWDPDAHELGRTPDPGGETDG